MQVNKKQIQHSSAATSVIEFVWIGLFKLIYWHKHF